MREERQMTESDSTTAQAADKAQEMAGQAKEQAQQTAGQAKEQLRSQVDQRSTMAGEQVKRQADDIRTVAEQLREQGKEGPAKIAEQAAERAERVGSYLQQSDADRILSDVEDFARQRPWAVVAGGVALGFAASRFLKASGGDRYRGSTGGNGAGTQRRVGGAAEPTGYAIPSAEGTGLSATSGENELSSGVPPARHTPSPQAPTTPQTPATAPVTGTY
jgi:hypothetical protein